MDDYICTTKSSIFMETFVKLDLIYTKLCLNTSMTLSKISSNASVQLNGTGNAAFGYTFVVFFTCLLLNKFNS